MILFLGLSWKRLFQIHFNLDENLMKHSVFIVPSPNLFSKQSEVMNVARSENVVM